MIQASRNPWQQEKEEEIKFRCYFEISRALKRGSKPIKPPSLRLCSSYFQFQYFCQSKFECLLLSTST